MSPKALPCLFLLDVSCMKREGNSRGYMVGVVCPKCHFFERFNRQMEEEEDEFFEEVDRLNTPQFCVVCARRLDVDSLRYVGNVCRKCRGISE